MLCSSSQQIRATRKVVKAGLKVFFHPSQILFQISNIHPLVVYFLTVSKPMKCLGSKGENRNMMPRQPIVRLKDVL